MRLPSSRSRRAARHRGAHAGHGDGVRSQLHQGSGPSKSRAISKNCAAPVRCQMRTSSAAPAGSVGDRDAGALPARSPAAVRRCDAPPVTAGAGRWRGRPPRRACRRSLVEDPVRRQMRGERREPGGGETEPVEDRVLLPVVYRGEIRDRGGEHHQGAVVAAAGDQHAGEVGRAHGPQRTEVGRDARQAEDFVPPGLLVLGQVRGVLPDEFQAIEQVLAQRVRETQDQPLAERGEDLVRAGIAELQADGALGVDADGIVGRNRADLPVRRVEGGGGTPQGGGRHRGGGEREGDRVGVRAAQRAVVVPVSPARLDLQPVLGRRLQQQGARCRGVLIQEVGPEGAPAHSEHLLVVPADHVGAVEQADPEHQRLAPGDSQPVDGLEHQPVEGPFQPVAHEVEPVLADRAQDLALAHLCDQAAAEPAAHLHQAAGEPQQGDLGLLRLGEGHLQAAGRRDRRVRAVVRRQPDHPCDEARNGGDDHLRRTAVRAVITAKQLGFRVLRQRRDDQPAGVPGGVGRQDAPLAVEVIDQTQRFGVEPVADGLRGILGRTGVEAVRGPVHVVRRGADVARSRDPVVGEELQDTVVGLAAGGRHGRRPPQRRERPRYQRRHAVDDLEKAQGLQADGIAPLLAVLPAHEVEGAGVGARQVEAAGDRGAVSGGVLEGEREDGVERHVGDRSGDLRHALAGDAEECQAVHQAARERLPLAVGAFGGVDAQVQVGDGPGEVDRHLEHAAQVVGRRADPDELGAELEFEAQAPRLGHQAPRHPRSHQRQMRLGEGGGEVGRGLEVVDQLVVAPLAPALLREADADGERRAGHVDTALREVGNGRGVEHDVAGDLVLAEQLGGDHPVGRLVLAQIDVPAVAADEDLARDGELQHPSRSVRDLLLVPDAQQELMARQVEDGVEAQGGRLRLLDPLALLQASWRSRTA